MINSCKSDPLNARHAWRVSPHVRPRMPCNSRWYRERQQHRRRDGVAAYSHPLPLQQFSLASSWAWSWWRRLLGIGRRICHATCIWIWFLMQERPVTPACNEPDPNEQWLAASCWRSCGTSRHEKYAAESYFLRKRNSVPIAAMAWLSSTWIARAKTIVSSTWIWSE